MLQDDIHHLVKYFNLEDNLAFYKLVTGKHVVFAFRDTHKKLHKNSDILMINELKPTPQLLEHEKIKKII